MADMKQFHGSKVTVTTRNDDLQYEGIIHTVDEKVRKLVLKRVVDSNGVKHNGNQIFYADEITNFTITLQFNSLPSMTSKPPTMPLMLTMMVHRESDKNESKHKSNKENHYSSEDSSKDTDKENSRIFLSTLNKEKKKEPSKDVSDDGPRLFAPPARDPYHYLSGDFMDSDNVKLDRNGKTPSIEFIDAFGDKFDSAIAALKKHRVVGLSAEGSDVSRFGHLSLLVFGCVDTIYVFDILQLGDRCFTEKALKSVLESHGILKVMHDCRRLSDYLCHKNNIQLTNIFDTQVADVIVYKQTRGSLPSHLGGLLSSLNEYLHISPDEPRFRSLFKSHSHRTNALWDQRPLKEEIIKAAAEQVMYLRELRTVFVERMLMEFLHGVDLYLSHMRDAPDRAVKKKMDGELPRGFQRLGQLEEKRRGRYKHGDRQRYARSLLPDTSNPEELATEEDKPNRRPWVGKRDFASDYQRVHGRVVEMINDNDDNDSQSSQDYLSDDQTIDLKPSGEGRMDKILKERLGGSGKFDNESGTNTEGSALDDDDVSESSNTSSPSARRKTANQTELEREERDTEEETVSSLPTANNCNETDSLTISKDSSKAIGPSGINKDKRAPISRGALFLSAIRGLDPSSPPFHPKIATKSSSELVTPANALYQPKRISSSNSEVRTSSKQGSSNHGWDNNHAAQPKSEATSARLVTPSDFKTFPSTRKSQNTIFEPGDFPTLGDAASLPKESKISSKNSRVRSPASNDNDTKVGLASARSVMREPVYGRGRARTRDFYSGNPGKSPIVGVSEDVLRDLKAIPFPSDGELLRTPLVTKAAGPVRGESVNLKRVNDDDDDD